MGWSVALLVAALSMGASASTGPRALELEGVGWRAWFDPATLECRMRLEGRAEVLVSAAGAARLVADIEASAGRATWRLPGAGLKVECRATEQGLLVRFTATGPGRVQWPLVEPGTSAQAWMLPFYEGAYVPAGHALWCEFLQKRSPMDTTGGLVMPFVGVRYRWGTLTYLLENPFDNQVSFAAPDGALSALVEHRFTPLAWRDPYGVLVVPGGGSAVEPAKVYREWLIRRGEFVTLKQKAQAVPAVCRLFGAAHAYLWGDGVSVEMLERLSRAGIRRMWLGLQSRHDAEANAEVVRRAKELGYLIGPYDSYHSIHSPDEQDTWETAQFDRALYETGPVVGADGRKVPGFQRKGYALSPLAARPYVERRVRQSISRMVEPVNSWFIDCDAAGELYEDHSPLHAAARSQDARARLDRMAWIRDTFALVVGSEKGSAYAAPVIHFAHGMTTPAFGWTYGNIRRDRNSPYFLGAWWPPQAPERFFQPARLRPEYKTLFYDPRYRLPLYQVALHDSVVTSHHWEYGSLKFPEVADTVELIELLYAVPPLYHLNLDAWGRWGERIKRHCAFFAPLHERLATVPMTEFAYLTEDRLVQRTQFGEVAEVVANFRQEPFQAHGLHVPPRSVAVKWLGEGQVSLYSPSDAGP